MVAARMSSAREIALEVLPQDTPPMQALGMPPPASPST
jgi:hypothetical protein